MTRRDLQTLTLISAAVALLVYASLLNLGDGIIDPVPFFFLGDVK